MQIRKILFLTIIFLFIGASFGIKISGISLDKQTSKDYFLMINGIEVGGNIFYVGGTGPNNYSKIQNAIDNASDGDTVYVYHDSSPYYEHLEVIKPINVVGENRDSTIIDGESIGNIVVLSSDFIKFTGFTIKNSGEGGIGIFVKGINNGLVSNNIISDTFIGIKLFDKDKTSENNIITNNIILSSTAFGIQLQNSNENTLSYNNISGTKSGSSIYIEYYSFNNLITHNNLISNSEGGIQVTSNDNVI